ncbi:MAG: alpha/beta hydrolase [Rhodospirillaceae bacterium]|nr:alpha/beta hydrolase [Rhodospirillaceae bacterium]
MIGLLAAEQQRGRFDKIITLGASPCYLNLDGYEGGLDRDQLNQLFLAIGSNYHAWAEAYANHAVSRPPEHPAALDFRNSLMAMRNDIALTTAQMILLGDYRDRLDAMTVPTVVLQTRTDPAVPLAAAQYLHDHLKGSVLEILETSGHMPHMTSPDIVLGALHRHLRDTRSAATVGTG